MSAPKVYAAIAEVMAELAKTGIGKDGRNQTQGYNFRGIDQVYGALAPLLAKAKLCVIPRMLERDMIEKTTKTGGALFYTTVKAQFDFVSAEDGTKHEVITFGEAMDSGDKSTNKAMSAAYKYAAFMTFCIPVEGESPDADATTHEVAGQKAAPKAAAPKADTSPADKDKAGVLAVIKKMEAIDTDEAAKALLGTAKARAWRDDIKKRREDLATLIDDASRAMLERIGKKQTESDGWPGPVPGEENMAG